MFNNTRCTLRRGGPALAGGACTPGGPGGGRQPRGAPLGGAQPRGTRAAGAQPQQSK